jgi:hypothetical protein
VNKQTPSLACQSFSTWEAGCVPAKKLHVKIYFARLTVHLRFLTFPDMKILPFSLSR